MIEDKRDGVEESLDGSIGRGQVFEEGRQT